MIDQRTGAWYPDYFGQRPEMDPQYIRTYGIGGQNQAQNGQQNGQAMTPPTIHAGIIMIDDFAEMDRYPVAPGTNQMFATKDENHFAIRAMYANGEHADTFYDKRPPAPPKPEINPAEYARKDEIAALVAEAIQNMKGGK